MISSFNSSIQKVATDDFKTETTEDGRDFLEKILKEFGEALLKEAYYAKSSENSGVDLWDIQTATYSILPSSEIRRHAVSEGMRVATRCGLLKRDEQNEYLEKKELLTEQEMEDNFKTSGLSFPLIDIYREMKARDATLNVTFGAAIYFTAVVEYLAAEVLELSGKKAKEAGSKLNAQNVIDAINNDPELKVIFFPAAVKTHRSEVTSEIQVMNNAVSQSPKKRKFNLISSSLPVSAAIVDQEEAIHPLTQDDCNQVKGDDQKEGTRVIELSPPLPPPSFSASSGNGPSLKFVSDPVTLEAINSPDSLFDAMLVCEAIVRTDRFQEILRTLIDDCECDIPTLVTTNRLSEITLKTMTLETSLNAYAVVYRQDEPFSIFLNPFVLMHAVWADGNREKKLLWKIFFVVKILHEFAHLVHPILSPSLLLQIMPKVLGGGGKKKMITPSKVIGEDTFNNLGEMSERTLFGGIVSLHCKHLYPGDVVGLLMTPSRNSKDIYTVKAKDFFCDNIDNQLHCLRLEPGTIFKGPTDKPTSGRLLVQSFISLAGPDVASDAEDPDWRLTGEEKEEDSIPVARF